MHAVRLIMGMPIEVRIVSEDAGASAALEGTFVFFSEVDERFSTYKETSEISSINWGEVALSDASEDMQDVFARAKRARSATNGYFDITRPDGSIDPSGIVKGWAVRRAAERLREAGFEDFSINAGGDIQCAGYNESGAPWSVGIENPLNRSQIVKVVYPGSRGMATSGSYIRGAHIYDPHDPDRKLDTVASITVIGSDIEEADIFATAAFAMGEEGVSFIDAMPGFEAYQIGADGIATMTAGFSRYTRV